MNQEIKEEYFCKKILNGQNMNTMTALKYFSRPLIKSFSGWEKTCIFDIKIGFPVFFVQNNGGNPAELHSIVRNVLYNMFWWERVQKMVPVKGRSGKKQ